MNRVDGYNAYRANLYEKPSVKEQEKKQPGQVKEAAETAKKEKVELSENAKNLLKELQRKYGNMDFIVADYETDEEAAQYLSRGTGEYSVLMTPEELEKMAADADHKEKNLKTLDDAIAQLDEMKTRLQDKGQQVSRIGILIGKEGELSYFAELEKLNEKQRERIEEKREQRNEGESRSEKLQAYAEKRQEESREPVKRTTVHATTVEELLEKISKVDWSAVKAQQEPVQGSKIDFTA